MHAFTQRLGDRACIGLDGVILALKNPNDWQNLAFPTTISSRQFQNLNSSTVVNSTGVQP